MRVYLFAGLAVATLLAGCGKPAETQNPPQWGRGSNAATAPAPNLDVAGPPTMPAPTVPIDTSADGVPYGAAAVEPGAATEGAEDRATAG